jgi:hypothetical protein
MGKITIDQSHSVMSILAVNTDWDGIDFEDSGLQDAIIRDPKGAGERFAAFLKNGCRFNFCNPKSFLTKPFNLVNFISAGWSILEDIEAAAEINVSSMIFETCLKDGETVISGEESLLRQKAKNGFIRFGANVLRGLLLDYQANKENSVLEFLYYTKNIQYLYFFGTILRNSDGYHGVLYLYRNDDGVWSWRCDLLRSDWDSERLSAGRAS